MINSSKLQRLAKISGGVAVIKVGGAMKLKLKNEKIELMMHLMLLEQFEEGVVTGGGCVLYAASVLDGVKVK